MDTARRQISARILLTLMLLTLILLNQQSGIASPQSPESDKTRSESSIQIDRLAIERFHAGHTGLLNGRHAAGAVRQQPSPRESQQLDVEHYNLAITLAPITAEIRGSNLISLRALSPLKRFYLNLSDLLTVDEVLLDGEKVTSLSRRDNRLWLELSGPLDTTRSYQLRIDYHGKPLLDSPLGTGLIFSQHNGQPVVASVSEPYSAPSWWPCIDDAADKATVEVAVTVPPPLLAISNGSLREQRDNPDGTRTFYWQEQYPIATYLVAIAASDYLHFTDQTSSRSGRQLPLNFYVFDEDYQGAAESFAITSEALPLLEGMFGDYPFSNEHYGMVEIPWLGAIENQTISGIGASLLRHSDPTALIVHELAHQWWGDAVSLNNWRDIWLNEGFATYTEVLYFERKFHQSPGELMSRLDDGKAAGRLAGTVIATDINNPFADVDAVYDKGAWVLHMLRGVMGDEAFFTALQTYHSRYAYRNAGSGDLQRVCEEVSGNSLGWFFRQWLYTPLRPIYSFDWQVKLQDRRWLLEVHLQQLQSQAIDNGAKAHKGDKKSPAGVSAYQMPIELSIDYPDGSSERRTVFNSARAETFLLELSRAPLTVNLDRDNWLLKELRRDPIAGSNKAPYLTINGSQTLGSAPFTIELSAMIGESDHESRSGEFQHYLWRVGMREVGNGKQLNYTFSRPGRYQVTVTALDRQGNAVTAATEVVVE